MRKWIKAFIQWTERKWPDRVVVSQKDYDQMKADIIYLKAEITKFNASLGFAGVKVAAGGQWNPLAR